MFKKILLLFTVLTLISCNATKSPIVTTKDVAEKTKNKVSRYRSTKRTSSSNYEKPSKVEQNRNVVLESTSRTVVSNDIIGNYIYQYKDVAMSNMKTYGIPASIILAQGILESGAGRGDLAQSANNHFGIKCHSDWTGETVRHDDDARQECFRKYNHVSESYRDHALFLTGKSRYSSLFDLSKGDYKAWARGLRKAGYATDPNYPQKLISNIEKYNLDQYDAMVLGNKYVPRENQEIRFAEVASDNGNYHEVQKGDTLYSISKKYNLLVDDLKRINKLSDNTLSIGQKLRVN